MRYAHRNFIQHKVPCLFLYNHKEQRDEIVAHCLDFGIDATSVSMRDIERSEPLLSGSSLRYAVRVPDHVFDSAQLLQSIAKHVCEKGASFYPVTGLETIRGAWDGARWHIFLDADQEIECHSIILACGVYLPEMLEQLLPGQARGFKRTKNPVLVLRGETSIARSMLITPREVNAPHLVPFTMAE